MTPANQSRHLVTLDLDPHLHTKLAELAGDVSCSTSGLANLAISMMLDAIAQDALDLRAYLTPADCSRGRFKQSVKSLPIGKRIG
jgi:hypothetical protein